MTVERAHGPVGFGWRFVVPVLTGPALNPINTSTIAVALVPISHDLHTSAATAIWLVAGLYLTSAVAQPTLGTLADRFGARRIYLIGLVVTLLASFVPLAWHSFPGVLTARVLIGVGTSASYPAALSLIRDRSVASNRPTPPALLSGLSITAQATTAIGPVLGGVLIAAFGWPSIFLVNVPIAAVALVMTLTNVPASRPAPAAEQSRPRIDTAGIALFALTMTTLLWFLLHLSIGTLWLVIVATASAAALVLWEMHQAAPFLDVRMLGRNRALTRTYARQLLIYFGAYTMMYGFSQWLGGPARLSADQVGYLQLPTAIVAVVAGLTIARTRGLRTPLIIAGAVPVIGGVAVALVHATTPLIILVSIAAAFGVPQGLASVANQAALYRQAPAAQLGTASGLARTSVYLGAILSSALIGLVYPHTPTSAGLHHLGLVTSAAGALAFLLALTDKAISDRERPADAPPPGPPKGDISPGGVLRRPGGRPTRPAVANATRWPAWQARMARPMDKWVLPVPAARGTPRSATGRGRAPGEASTTRLPRSCGQLITCGLGLCTAPPELARSRQERRVRRPVRISLTRISAWLRRSRVLSGLIM
ncbi:hypothetical protein Airi02_102530 [Actinoallomurus iriomotensis]|uniref:Major facilitator superfamily (MFS) profile domain-containing protein n=1 Tax=Actinoallomurus iriomotensis TaxID=478107 RepID=A0A9W6SCK3_9ACTN|nr:hypothetical protein Airi02_102530 [Actinoallomurus iriomotensis]